MTTVVYPTPPAVVWFPQSIRDGFALAARSRPRTLAASSTNRRFGADAASLVDLTDWFIGGLAIASSLAGAQIPIAI
jgi:hypothetical protein